MVKLFVIVKWVFIQFVIYVYDNLGKMNVDFDNIINYFF